MVEEKSAPGSERFRILRGPDGAVYMLSQANLDQHRVPDDIVPTLLEAYASQVAPARRKTEEAGSFEILATGTFSRKQFGMVPTDHWIDTM